MDGAGRTAKEHPSRSPQTWSTGNSYDHNVQGYYICTNYNDARDPLSPIANVQSCGALLEDPFEDPLMRSSSSSWWHARALLGRTMSELALLHAEEQC